VALIIFLQQHETSAKRIKIDIDLTKIDIDETRINVLQIRKPRLRMCGDIYTSIPPDVFMAWYLS